MTGLFRKIGQALLASLLFLVVLALVYLVHARFFPVDVVFYAALLDVVLALLISAGVLVLARALSVFEKVQMLLIWALVGYALAISVPTVIDRSLSFYILEKLAQRGGAIRQDRFAEVFTEEYLREHRLVDVRLTEQMKSGTIRLDASCVRLTDKGYRVATFGRFFRRHLLAKKRLLLDQYSDDLTDPFRASAAAPDYRCN